jgi:hypothetical protein
MQQPHHASHPANAATPVDAGQVEGICSTYNGSQRSRKSPAGKMAFQGKRIITPVQPDEADSMGHQHSEWKLDSRTLQQQCDGQYRLLFNAEIALPMYKIYFPTAKTERNSHNWIIR